MPIPKLLHPIGCTVQPLNTAATVYDENAREEIQIVGRSQSFVIPVQVEYRDSVMHALGEAQYDRRGIKANETGYILVRYKDAKAKGWTPKIGDRIKELGTDTENPQEVTAYIHRLKPTMHYRRLGATAVKCFFADRKPSHNG